eukprot:gnl/Dysnectes_brevis/4731_a6497_849.p1 GENE.gnl/Dysnectes_brevis/4731_a6497_849~~gnl/Dysnectes_brevis/4731_a6497_849.p1  ORF type:complete len:368 (+),score=44.79 gnl/Dysnectes_brevis/4731_a6497_849:64-1104(+)
MQQHNDDSHPQCGFCHEHHNPGNSKHLPMECPLAGCTKEVSVCSMKEHMKMEHSEHLFEENKLLHELIQRLQRMQADKETQRLREENLQLKTEKHELTAQLTAERVSSREIREQLIRVEAELKLQRDSATGLAAIQRQLLAMHQVSFLTRGIRKVNPGYKFFEKQYVDTNESRLQAAAFAVNRIGESFITPIRDLVEHDVGRVAFSSWWGDRDDHRSDYRLVRLPGIYGAWVAKALANQYVTITFTAPVAICGIAVAGRCRQPWVNQSATRFKVEFLCDGIWAPLPGSPEEHAGEFKGPHHTPSDMRLDVHVLPEIIVSRGIKITILKFKTNPGMRFGVFGWQGLS